ncbi:hypothetical protein PV325_003898 [Microctonus aethiopoides]|nr:hypothetical protein PV325_003898 [Microctonus aethiopoides]
MAVADVGLDNDDDDDDDDDDEYDTGGFEELITFPYTFEQHKKVKDNSEFYGITVYRIGASRPQSRQTAFILVMESRLTILRYIRDRLQIFACINIDCFMDE